MSGETPKDARPSGSSDGDVPRRSAKVPGDRDEAKALPDDVTGHVHRGPDADVHQPAAAASNTDEEAGADTSEGRIEPLSPRARPGARRD
jgi:hypothetical protein